MPTHHIPHYNLGSRILSSLTSSTCDSCLPAPWRGLQASFPAGFNKVALYQGHLLTRLWILQSSTAVGSSEGWQQCLGIPWLLPAFFPLPFSVAALSHLSICPQTYIPLNYCHCLLHWKKIATNRWIPHLPSPSPQNVTVHSHRFSTSFCFMGQDPFSWPRLSQYPVLLTQSSSTSSCFSVSSFNSALPTSPLSLAENTSSRFLGKNKSKLSLTLYLPLHAAL